MGPDAMILVFWMLSFKPTFSLSSFTFIKRLFSSSSLSAKRVVSSAYLRLAWYFFSLSHCHLVVRFLYHYFPFHFFSFFTHCSVNICLLRSKHCDGVKSNIKEKHQWKEKKVSRIKKGSHETITQTLQILCCPEGTLQQRLLSEETHVKQKCCA